MRPGQQHIPVPDTGCNQGGSVKGSRSLTSSRNKGGSLGPAAMPEVTSTKSGWGIRCKGTHKSSCGIPTAYICGRGPIPERLVFGISTDICAPQSKIPPCISWPGSPHTCLPQRRMIAIHAVQIMQFHAPAASEWPQYTETPANSSIGHTLQNRNTGGLTKKHTHDRCPAALKYRIVSRETMPSHSHYGGSAYCQKI